MHEEGHAQRDKRLQRHAETRQDQQAHPTTVDYDARILDPLVDEIDGWLRKDFPTR
jgi:hypothetical protein